MKRRVRLHSFAKKTWHTKLNVCHGVYLFVVEPGIAYAALIHN
jgi:hypothetical protein